MSVISLAPSRDLDPAAERRRRLRHPTHRKLQRRLDRRPARPDPVGDLKDALHDRLLRRTREDAAGCWNFDGRSSDGTVGLVRVGESQYVAPRVAAWVWFGPRRAFDLDDSRDEIRHSCKNECCCNPDHMYLLRKDVKRRKRRECEAGAVGAVLALARTREPGLVQTWLDGLAPPAPAS